MKLFLPLSRRPKLGLPEGRDEELCIPKLAPQEKAPSSKSYSRAKAVSRLNLCILHALLHPCRTGCSLSHFHSPHRRAACLTCCNRRETSPEVHCLSAPSAENPLPQQHLAACRGSMVLADQRRGLRETPARRGFASWNSGGTGLEQRGRKLRGVELALRSASPSVTGCGRRRRRRRGIARSLAAEVKLCVCACQSWARTQALEPNNCSAFYC